MKQLLELVLEFGVGVWSEMDGRVGLFFACVFLGFWIFRISRSFDLFSFHFLSF